MVSSVAWVVFPLFLALGLLRKYREYKWGRCKSTTPLNGRVFLVTGANSGTGKETAKELARRNARVIMACRDLDNAQLAINEIRKSVSEGELIPMHLDLASFESIRNFAEDVLHKFPQIHVLINNAGVYFPMTDTQKTKNGYEMNFGVNHLGHFLLTKLLLERLKVSSPSRIVIVSSGLHERGNIDINDLNMEKRRDVSKNMRINPGYCASKLANVYHCRELAKRLKGNAVDVHAVCPGFTFTGLFRYSNIKWYQYILFTPVAFFYLRSSWQGAQTILHCATEEKLTGHSGNFYRNCELYKSTVNFDPQLQLQLWEKSDHLVSK